MLTITLHTRDHTDIYGYKTVEYTVSMGRLYPTKSMWVAYKGESLNKANRLVDLLKQFCRLTTEDYTYRTIYHEHIDMEGD